MAVRIPTLSECQLFFKRLIEQDGYNYVIPYTHVFTSVAKERWVGEKLVDVFTSEFLGDDRTYFEQAILSGRLSVNKKTVKLDYVVKTKDDILHKAHRHEPCTLSVRASQIVSLRPSLTTQQPSRGQQCIITMKNTNPIVYSSDYSYALYSNIEKSYAEHTGVDCSYFSDDVLSHNFRIDDGPERHRIRPKLIPAIDLVNEQWPGLLEIFSQHYREQYRIKIVYEDDAYLVVNKPPSLPIHAAGQYSYSTVQNYLFYQQASLTNLCLEYIRNLTPSKTGLTQDQSRPSPSSADKHAEHIAKQIKLSDVDCKSLISETIPKEIFFDPHYGYLYDKVFMEKSVADKTALERDLLSLQDSYLVLRNGHRLDRMTSGILMYTKSQDAARSLARRISGRSVQKEYIALVNGKFDLPAAGSGTEGSVFVTAPLANTDLKKGLILATGHTIDALNAEKPKVGLSTNKKDPSSACLEQQMATTDDASTTDTIADISENCNKRKKRTLEDIRQVQMSADTEYIREICTGLTETTLLFLSRQDAHWESSLRKIVSLIHEESHTDFEKIFHFLVTNVGKMVYYTPKHSSNEPTSGSSAPNNLQIHADIVHLLQLVYHNKHGTDSLNASQMNSINLIKKLTEKREFPQDGHGAESYIDYQQVSAMFEKDVSAQAVFERLIGAMRDRKTMKRLKGFAGKDSLTEFRLLSYNSATNQSLVHCIPKTGRTHQIRVHLQYLGFPIANDTLYNSSVFGEKYDFGRGGLHHLEHVSLLKETTSFCHKHTVDFGALRSSLVKYRGGNGRWQASVVSSCGNQQDLISEHHRLMAPDYMQMLYSDPLNMEIPVSISSKYQTPDELAVLSDRYDPACNHCKSIRLDPPLETMLLYLHSFRYSSCDWDFKSNWPSWAKLT